jgi:hypothetical protein
MSCELDLKLSSAIETFVDAVISKKDQKNEIFSIFYTVFVKCDLPSGLCIQILYNLVHSQLGVNNKDSLVYPSILKCEPSLELEKLKTEVLYLNSNFTQASKLLSKTIEQYKKFEETLESTKSVEAVLQKLQKYKNTLQSKINELSLETELKQFKSSGELSPIYETSTILKASESDHIKYLETLLFISNAKLANLIKIANVKEETIAIVNSEINYEYGLDAIKKIEIEEFRVLEKENSNTYFKLVLKINEACNRIQKIQTKLAIALEKSKESSKNKGIQIQTLLNQLFELDSKTKDLETRSEELKACQKVIETQETELKSLRQLKSRSCSLNNSIMAEDTKKQQIEILQKNYEDLLLINLQLKADAAGFEDKQNNLRKMEEDLKSLTNKCALFEKANKELKTKKKDESDDSLDLDCSNIKDAIEIQELRAALSSISEKYEQEKEIILRDCLESRQDIETQMFRMKNEKNYIEIKLKNTEKQLSELIKEKEKLEVLVIDLKKEVERIKDVKVSEFLHFEKPELYRMNSEDHQMSVSGDFDLTESMDKLGMVNSNDLYEMLVEDINELASQITQNQLVPMDNRSSKDTIQKLIESNLKIKYMISNEVSSHTNKSILDTLHDIFHKYKQKIAELEKENTEYQKKIDDILKYDRLEIQTEPSPRVSIPNSSLESSSIVKKQLQKEKSKVYEKKHEIHLHKEQILYLKQNIRDLQLELDRISKLDMSHLKEIWWNLGKEIPLLNTQTEDMIEVLMKMLGFNAKEISNFYTDRKYKKAKPRFGFFS